MGEVEEAEELLELIDPGLAEADVRDEIDDTDPDENLPDGEVETDSRNLRNSLVKIGKVGEKKLKEFFGRGENDEEVETDSRVEEIPTEDRELALARAGPKKIKKKPKQGNESFKGKNKNRNRKKQKPRKPKKVKEEEEEEENGLRAIKKLTRKIITLLMKPEVKPWMLKGLKDNLEKSYEINENIAGGKLFSEGKVKFDKMGKNGKKGFQIATDSFSTYKVGASSGKDISLLDLLKP